MFHGTAVVCMPEVEDEKTKGLVVAHSLECNICSLGKPDSVLKELAILVNSHISTSRRLEAMPFSPNEEMYEKLWDYYIKNNRFPPATNLTEGNVHLTSYDLTR